MCAFGVEAPRGRLAAGRAAGRLLRPLPTIPSARRLLAPAVVLVLVLVLVLVPKRCPPLPLTGMFLQRRWRLLRPLRPGSWRECIDSWKSWSLLIFFLISLISKRSVIRTLSGNWGPRRS